MTLDDLFGGSEPMGSFGSQDTFFGGGHFKKHFKQHFDAHNHHHHQHHNAHQRARRSTFTGSTFSENSQSRGKTCRTVRQQVGNMVTHYTTCS